MENGSGINNDVHYFYNELGMDVGNFISYLGNSRFNDGIYLFYRTYS